MTKPIKTVSGKGAWRISFDEDGAICAVELWKDNSTLASAGIGATYEVLDIKSRMRPT